MCYSVKFIAWIGSFGLATHPKHRWVALSVITACVAASSVLAQNSESVPVIRVDARQVLIPTNVWARIEGMEREARHLATRDFRLFEDNKEQIINAATLLHPYWTPILVDNLDHQYNEALPRGEYGNIWERI